MVYTHIIYYYLPTSMQTFTITFGDQAENHVGMEKLGNLLPHGFSHADLTSIKAAFDLKNFTTEMHHLNDLIDDEKTRASTEDAYVLVVRQGLEALVPSPNDVDAFYEEQKALEKDRQALMYGRVVNKHARHNLCFADVGHAADIAHGQGTVVAFGSVPLLAHVRDSIEDLTGHRLVAEGNYYYDIQKCGIGYHGDAERRVVIGIRLGADMPLHYRWYHNSEVVSRTLKLMLGHGDVYFMSEKATGFDWKLRSQYTLRHAAGSKKFLDQ